MSLKQIQELLEHLQELVADSPYKNSFIWALALTPLIGYSYFNHEYILWSAIFFILVICFSFIFEVAFPWINNLHKKQRDKRQLKDNIYIISDKQKEIILDFFPYPKASKCFDDHYLNPALMDLIENKILFLIHTYNYDLYPEALGAKVKLTEYTINFIRQNNLLESWKQEISLEEEKIDSLSTSDSCSF